MTVAFGHSSHFWTSILTGKRSLLKDQGCTIAQLRVAIAQIELTLKNKADKQAIVRHGSGLNFSSWPTDGENQFFGLLDAPHVHRFTVIQRVDEI
ncbi:hypothetical protein [Phormidium nigroviride]